MRAGIIRLEQGAQPVSGLDHPVMVLGHEAKALVGTEQIVCHALAPGASGEKFVPPGHGEDTAFLGQAQSAGHGHFHQGAGERCVVKAHALQIPGGRGGKALGRCEKRNPGAGLGIAPNQQPGHEKIGRDRHHAAQREE